MKTSVSNAQFGRDIEAACRALLAGGIIAYPTEGVFGLGCDPDNQTAIQNLLSIKKRSPDRGFILIAASREQLCPYIGTLDKTVETRLTDSWPGPVTWILPCSTRAPDVLTGGKGTIAARVTDHPIASTLCSQCNSAIISTSANISGESAHTEAQSVAALFGNKLSYTLDYEVGDLQGPTPIFEATTGKKLR